ncbi:flagellar biosynthetic protein FliO [Hyphomicrobium facile]|uniref:Flagellar biosynthesis protein, FliO n=1 Tax=Hyphomicrobium facile TaxID=51670 RepID=A0A1I7N3A3_9HYPH|nr:flagellar biosynthetic protein FliO [Hyphomicrobium facile]SFV29083.1 Flagellar biosynthesis protein, FliO [Hyphomicrobium facile]
METYVFWTFLLAVIALLCAGAAVFVRAYLTGTAPSAFLFRQKGERRLDVVDQASVDSRRKLVLIRRDDVEHLVMIGGPVDLVIESGINSSSGRPATEAPSEAVAAPVRRTPFFNRSPEPADHSAPPPKL